MSGVSDARNVHVKNSISRSVKHVKRILGILSTARYFLALAGESRAEKSSGEKKVSQYGIRLHDRLLYCSTI